MLGTSSRPATGPGHYLRDVVYGAIDGVITTLAVIAGVSGAALAPAVAIILGLANLFADGLSMGASNYLGIKSELEQTGRSVAHEKPWRHGFATTVAFMLAGAVPLSAFFLPAGGPVFAVAIALSAVVLIVVGGARAPFTGRSVAWCAMEMLLVGGLAGAVAFAVGAAAHAWIG